MLDAVENPLRFNPDSGAFGPGLQFRDDVRHMKPLGLLRDGSLAVQSWHSEAATGKLTTCYFDRFDGVQYQPLAEPPPDPDTVGICSTLFAARNGDLWLSGDKGTAWYHEKKWRAFPVSDRAVPDAVLLFTELADGRIWCATQNELWEFNGHDWSSMHAGFDHINALHCARDGNVWVADDAGVHRYFQKVWIENDREDGLPDATVHEIFEDQHGNIWAGTPHGLSRFHPEADPDPPRTFIEKPATGNCVSARAILFRSHSMGRTNGNSRPGTGCFTPTNWISATGRLSCSRTPFPFPTCRPAGMSSRRAPWTATGTLIPSRRWLNLW